MASKSRQPSKQKIQKFIDDLEESDGSEYSDISDDEEGKLNFYSFQLYEKQRSSRRNGVLLKIVGRGLQKTWSNFESGISLVNVDSMYKN